MVKKRIRAQEEFDFNPEISRGLLALFLFVLSALAILSFFNLAGVAGNFLDSLLSIGFGYVKYLFPLVMIFIGILLVKNFEDGFKLPKILGALLFFLSINSIDCISNQGNKDVWYQHQIHNSIIDSFCFCGISFTF